MKTLESIEKRIGDLITAEYIRDNINMISACPHTTSDGDDGAELLVPICKSMVAIQPERYKGTIRGIPYIASNCQHLLIDNAASFLTSLKQNEFEKTAKYIILLIGITRIINYCRCTVIDFDIKQSLLENAIGCMSIISDKISIKRYENGNGTKMVKLMCFINRDLTDEIKEFYEHENLIDYDEDYDNYTSEYIKLFKSVLKPI